MAVLIPRKLIYLEHPRTGSTAIREALAKLPTAKTKSRHTLFLPERGEKVMSVVRNPFDCLVSWWLVVKDKWDYPDFKTFVAECNDSFMVRQGNLFYFAKYSDYVIRFEDLQNQLNKVMDQVKLPRMSLRRVNVTDKKLSYHHYYDPKTIDIVKRRFRSELRFFKYRFSGLKCL